jgi:hypothetical protein
MAGQRYETFCRVHRKHDHLTPRCLATYLSKKLQVPLCQLRLTWSGEIPSQKWMNFHTKILTKLGVNSGLRLTVRVDCKVEGGPSIQKVEELKSALRELGLDDRIE